MAQVQKGILMIADISGYTTYLSESELEHANSVLQTLLEVLIDNTRLPMIISRLQGDAVVSYAPEGSFLLGTSVLEMVETCYVAYRRAIELMIINTSCTCNACKNMPKLDLKFFIHHGSFALQPLPAYTELVGTDVNIIHRLVKNHVKERTGYQAYALFTQAAIQALGISELAQEMAQLQESYEDVGTVAVFVMDMHPVWESSRNMTRITVKDEEAVTILEYDFPVTRVQLWDYLVKPDGRALFLNSQSAVMENASGGRAGTGTVYICAHGSMVIRQTIVDWQPFETHTVYDITFGMPGYSTYQLSETENGSHLKVLIGPIQSRNPLKRWVGAILIKFMPKLFGDTGPQKFRQRMEEDLAQGVLQAPQKTDIDREALRRSMRAALAETQAAEDHYSSTIPNPSSNSKP
jgi:hypothetical protein